MSAVNNALSKLSEQSETNIKRIQKVEVPPIRRSKAPYVLIGIGLSVSVVVGGYFAFGHVPATAGELRAPDEPVQPAVSAQLAKPVQATVVQAEPVELKEVGEVIQPIATTAPVSNNVQVASATESNTPVTVETISVKAETAESQAPEQQIEPEVLIAKSSPQITEPAPKPETTTVKAKTKPEPVKGAQVVKSAQTVAANTSKATTTETVDSNGAVMTVEQVELTPQALSEKALARAQKALDANDAQAALNEFTKALRLVPTNEVTRQKLAALYYGKRDTRKAVDLLQQGIAINEEGERLRMALSKLLLKEQQNEAALAPLMHLPRNVTNDYLALRAGIAQQLKRADVALESYASLSQREPDNGRWWLGLAISQERSLEFDDALQSYQLALGKVGLSNSSQSFVRQRVALLTDLQGDNNGN